MISFISSIKTRLIEIVGNTAKIFVLYFVFICKLTVHIVNGQDKEFSENEAFNAIVESHVLLKNL